MKQTSNPCGVVAAAGGEETMKALLLVLRDVRETMQATGPPLRVTQATTLTEIKTGLAPSGIGTAPEILLCSMTQKDAGWLDEFLTIAGRNPNLQILLLVSKEAQAQTVYRCRKYQIYVLSLPLRRQILSEMLRMMLTMRGRMLEKDEELYRMRKKINEIGFVTKAKCLLIEHRKMTEDEAHHYLEKSAMDNGVTKKEAAADIIRQYA